MKIRTLAWVLLLVSPLALGAPVDGKWTGSIDTQNGPGQITFTFKADGKTLTGTNTGPDGNTIALKNGKIDGNKISFSIDVNFGGNSMTFDYTGVVSAKDIKLHTEFMGMPIDFTVTKAG